MPDDDSILSDPLFQLNLVLWTLMRSPPTADIKNILFRLGYFLRSISQQLAIPPERRVLLQAGAARGFSAAPDLIASHSGADPWLLIECKASSFSPESTTAQQARKLIILAPDIATALGERAGEIRVAKVLYVTKLTDSTDLSQTLLALRTETSAAGNAGDVAVIGLSRSDAGLLLNVVSDSALPPNLSTNLPAPEVVLSISRDEDPRPLYVIPCDPSCEGGQSDEMKTFGRALLAQRGLIAAACKVGRSEIPTHLVIDCEELLPEITFGTSSRWRDAPAVRQAAGRICEAIGKRLSRVADLVVLYASTRVELTLNNDESQRRAIEALQRPGRDNAEDGLSEQEPLF